MPANREMLSVYSVNDICDLFGIKNDKATREYIMSPDFPFPSIIVKHTHYFPKKPIDDWLAGKRPQSIVPSYERNKGRKKKWSKENSLNWNYPMPKDLNEKFDKVCQNINKTLSTPISKGDFIRVAIEEFIERRPEFLNES